jgi:ABC-type antimicrobial peptide transport system permease subunit
VRIALGARPAQVLWLILRQVSVLALAGLALGVPTALIAVRVIRSLLFGVASTDVLSITIAAAVMLGVAFAAGAQPALRAARLDPLKTLRTE